MVKTPRCGRPADFRQQLAEAAAHIRATLLSKKDGRYFHPKIGLIIGSTLKRYSEQLTEPRSILQQDIPHVAPGDTGERPGRLWQGRIGPERVLMMDTRPHLADGWEPWETVVLPLAMASLGCNTFIIINKAGGLREKQQIGDLVLIADQILGPGCDPLTGYHDPALTARFPLMNQVFCPNLRNHALSIAEQLGLTKERHRTNKGAVLEPREPLVESGGIYAELPGPCHPTPSQITELPSCATLFGFSTAHEAAALHAYGRVRLLAISAITKVWSAAKPDVEPRLAKAERPEITRQSRLSLERLLTAIITTPCPRPAPASTRTRRR